jgi:hypothetical protein
VRRLATTRCAAIHPSRHCAGQRAEERQNFSGLCTADQAHAASRKGWATAEANSDIIYLTATEPSDFPPFSRYVPLMEP